jgi:hypothetical protein
MEEDFDNASSTAYSLSTACADAKIWPAGFLRSTNLSLVPRSVMRKVGLLCLRKTERGELAGGAGGLACVFLKYVLGHA